MTHRRVLEIIDRRGDGDHKVDTLFSAAAAAGVRCMINRWNHGRERERRAEEREKSRKKRTSS